MQSIEIHQLTLLKYTEMMLKIHQSILEKTNEQDLLDLIMNELYRVFGHKDCGCILIEKDGYLRMVSQVGYTEAAMKAFKLETHKSYFWRYAQGDINKVYCINQIDLIEQEDYSKVAESNDGKEMISSISAPIIIDGKLYGLINFDSPERDAFTHEQISIMEYVRVQLSFAIKNMQLYEKMLRLSRYDQMTGLMNRHYFEMRVNEHIKSAQSENKPLLLTVCDVDGLKQVNDQYGHLIGDDLLIAVASAIQSACGDNALVARFGGDEFVACVIGMPLQTLTYQLESARALLMKTVIGPFAYSFSFGITEMLGDADDYYTLLRRADQAMYQEKQLRMRRRCDDL